MTLPSLAADRTVRKTDMLCSITPDGDHHREIFYRGTCYACKGTGSVWTGMPCLVCGGTGNR